MGKATADARREFMSILQRHSYRGLKKIGEGAFGVALLIEDTAHNALVAKMVSVTSATPKQVQEAKTEARLLSQFKHPYIVRYRDSFAEKGWLCIVMDYCGGGDLTQRIAKAKENKNPFSEELVVLWLTQSLMALKYLHDKKVLHRDLKPSNLFLTDNDDLRMGDFGISKVLDSTAAQAVSFVGTPYYISPEVIEEKPYSWPADVWSMGCIVYQLCSFRVPFEARTIEELARKITKSEIPVLPKEYSDGLRALCSKMMCRSLLDRLSTEAAMADPIIQAMVRKILAEKRQAKLTAQLTATAQEDGANAEKMVDEDPRLAFCAQRSIIQHFDHYDTNGDGVIDKAELCGVLQHVDKRVWTEDQIDLLIKAADCNRDGKIQFEEFVRWIFGGEGDIGLIKRACEMVEEVLQAGKQGNLLLFRDTLLRWRQAVDIGCLRLSDPGACVQSCLAIAEMAKMPGIVEVLHDNALDDVRHLSAILDTVEQLFWEKSRQPVARIASVTSPIGLLGLCFELADGTRVGQCLGGITDSGLSSASWEVLLPGERIVEVSGLAFVPSPEREPAPRQAPRRGRTPSPPQKAPSKGAPGNTSYPQKKDLLAASVRLSLSSGRVLEFGGVSSDSRGAIFRFRAPSGQHIEDIIFSGQTCTEVGMKTSDSPWSIEDLVLIHRSWRAAVDVVWPALLGLHRRLALGHNAINCQVPLQSRARLRHELMQARQLGLSEDSFADLAEPASAIDTATLVVDRPPRHWELSVMPFGPVPSDYWMAEDAQVGRVYLSAAEMTQMQVILKTSFVTFSDVVARVQAVTGLDLVRGMRLQTWKTWCAYSQRSAIIRAKVASEPCERFHVWTASCHPLGLELDEASNTVWLFHPIAPDDTDAASSTIFHIDRTSLCGTGSARLYGKGVYLTDSSSVADASQPPIAESADGLRCLLVCRVVLGRVLLDDSLFPDVTDLYEKCLDSGGYHSVVGSGVGRVAAAAVAARGSDGAPSALRQIVVYDSDQVYPELLLWYRRSYR